MIGICPKQGLYLGIKLFLHCLEQMTITNLVLGVWLNWCDLGPASLWLRIPDIEESETKIWDSSCINDGRYKNNTDQIRQKHC